jgi:hypothetical protein
MKFGVKTATKQYLSLSFCRGSLYYFTKVANSMPVLLLSIQEIWCFVVSLLLASSSCVIPLHFAPGYALVYTICHNIVNVVEFGNLARLKANLKVTFHPNAQIL